MPLSWTDTIAFDDVTLTMYRADGTVAGTIESRCLMGAGAQSYTWNGTLDGPGRCPTGQYMVQVVGTAGRHSAYYAPSRAPFVAGQMKHSRGRDRYDAEAGRNYPVPPVRVLDTRTAGRPARSLRRRPDPVYRVRRRGEWSPVQRRRP